MNPIKIVVHEEGVDIYDTDGDNKKLGSVGRKDDSYEAVTTVLNALNIEYVEEH